MAPRLLINGVATGVRGETREVARQSGAYVVGLCVLPCVAVMSKFG